MTLQNETLPQAISEPPQRPLTNPLKRPHNTSRTDQLRFLGGKLLCHDGGFHTGNKCGPISFGLFAAGVFLDRQPLGFAALLETIVTQDDPILGVGIAGFAVDFAVFESLIPTGEPVSMDRGPAFRLRRPIRLWRRLAL